MASSSFGEQGLLHGSTSATTQYFRSRFELTTSIEVKLEESLSRWLRSVFLHGRQQKRARQVAL